MTPHVRSKKPWMAAAFAAMLAVAAPQDADACSCMVPPGPAQALAGADAVFEGRVGTLGSSPGEGKISVPRISVPITVLRAWKGVEAGKEITVITSESSASCGYSFRQGETYLVYAARSQNGVLSVSLCSRTRRIADAADDLTALGAPGGAPPPASANTETPAPPSTPAPPATTSAPATTGSEPASVTPPPATPPSGGCAACAVPPGAAGGAGGLAAALFGITMLLRRYARTGRRPVDRDRDRA